MPKKVVTVKSNTVARAKKPPVKNWFSTGSILLDLAVADQLPGGFPSGRIVHIYGDPSTTKSVLALEPLGAAQRKEGKAYLADVECALDFSWAEVNGVKVFEKTVDDILIRDDFEVFNPQTLEEVFDELIPGIIDEIKQQKLQNSCVFSIDSLTALNSALDMTDKLTDATYGTSRAKQFGRAYRKVLRDINDVGLCVVAIDQLREKINQAYGDNRTYSGGRAVRYYSDVQILLDLDEVIKNERNVETGVVISFTIKKNRVGPPFRKAKFRFDFKYGIDDIGSSLQWLKENQPMSKEDRAALLVKVTERVELEYKGRKARAGTKEKKIKITLEKEIKAANNKSWFEFKGVKKRSLDEMIGFIERKGLEERLRKEVLRVWRILYKTEPRKSKVRF